MDAIKFIKEKARMCEVYENCIGCPFDENEELGSCIRWVKEHPTEAVAIVEKWSEENSRKTLKDDFLERCPNAEMGNCATIICAKSIYGSSIVNCASYQTCDECWNTPLTKEME